LTHSKGGQINQSAASGHILEAKGLILPRGFAPRRTPRLHHSLDLPKVMAGTGIVIAALAGEALLRSRGEKKAARRRPAGEVPCGRCRR